MSDGPDSLLLQADSPFARMLAASVGEGPARTVLSALSAPPSTSIRLNPARLKECLFDGGVPVPWSPHGYILPERPAFTLDPLFHAGCYYVQDSSAMFPCHILRSVLSGDAPAVLDLCAAPGGKTTDAAASLRERFGDAYLLVANEFVRKRFEVLRDNVALWGDPRVAVTNLSPAAIGASGMRFGIILADVPCSGEGMFRKESKALEDWSEEAVAFCASRQRGIIADVWPSLEEGGFLIYSTCTFNSSENDDNVGWICSELGAEPVPLPDFPPLLRTRYGLSLLPGFVPGEGQYAALLRKVAPRSAGKTAEIPSAGSVFVRSAGKTAENPSAAPKTAPSAGKTAENPSVGPVFARSAGKTAEIPSAGSVFARSAGKTAEIPSVGPVFARSAGKTAEIPSAARTLRLSFPAQAAAPEQGPRVDVDRRTALRYLHGDAIVLPDAPAGLITVCYEGHPLGPAKNIGPRCNNLFPKSRRIRIDIPSDI